MVNSHSILGQVTLFTGSNMFTSTKFGRKFRANGIGNFLEFFDFSMVGTLSDILGVNFFPPEMSAPTRLFASLAIYGAAFVMRPFGGILLGYIGDKVDRERALEISIGSMVLASFFIGCLPTYAQWGEGATVLLLLLRLVQGLACGGEVVGSFISTLESTPKSRSFWGGAIKATGNLGSAAGIGFVTLLRNVMSPRTLYAWGWRLPFFAGTVVGILGLYLRMRLRRRLVKERAQASYATLMQTGHVGTKVEVEAEAGYGDGLGSAHSATLHFATHGSRDQLLDWALSASKSSQASHAAGGTTYTLKAKGTEEEGEGDGEGEKCGQHSTCHGPAGLLTRFPSMDSVISHADPRPPAPSKSNSWSNGCLASSDSWCNGCLASPVMQVLIRYPLRVVSVVPIAALWACGYYTLCVWCVPVCLSSTLSLCSSAPLPLCSSAPLPPCVPLYLCDFHNNTCASSVRVRVRIPLYLCDFNNTTCASEAPVVTLTLT